MFMISLNNGHTHIYSHSFQTHKRILFRWLHDIYVIIIKCYSYIKQQIGTNTHLYAQL